MDHNLGPSKNHWCIYSINVLLLYHKEWRFLYQLIAIWCSIMECNLTLFSVSCAVSHRNKHLSCISSGIILWFTRHFLSCIWDNISWFMTQYLSLWILLILAANLFEVLVYAYKWHFNNIWWHLFLRYSCNSWANIDLIWSGYFYIILGYFEWNLTSLCLYEGIITLC